MNEIGTDTEEMANYDDEDVFGFLGAHSAASILRPRPPVFACDCAERLDELISLIRALADEIRRDRET